MKPLLTLVIAVVACFILAYVGAGIWWGVWMDHGWIGPPGVLAKLVHADAEYYYDAIFDEMLLVLFFIKIIVFFILRRFWRDGGSE